MTTYSAMRWNNTLTRTTRWVDLANRMLSERSQIQKITYCLIPLICNVQNRQIHRDWRLPGTAGRKGEMESNFSLDTEFPFGMIKMSGTRLMMCDIVNVPNVSNGEFYGLNANRLN